MISLERFLTKFSVSSCSLRPRVKGCGWNREWEKGREVSSLSLYCYIPNHSCLLSFESLEKFLCGWRWWRWWCIKLFKCSAWALAKLSNITSEVIQVNLWNCNKKSEEIVFKVHEEVMSKLWTSYELVMDKMLTKCEHVISKYWTRNEHVMNNSWPSNDQVKNK